MSKKAKSADLILKLYDLRREETMRRARDWFMRFNPETAEELFEAARGEHSAYYRMVTTYWDMACSFVNHGALDEEMFNDANAEHLFVYAKIHPFIDEVRAVMGPQYLEHLDKVALRAPGAEERLAHLRGMSKKFAEARAAAEAERAQADAANA